MKEVIEKLSDRELEELINDYRLVQIPENSIVRKVIIEAFGKEELLVLQMNQLLWTILEVVSERMFIYSPHIQ